MNKIILIIPALFITSTMALAAGDGIQQNSATDAVAGADTPPPTVKEPPPTYYPAPLPGQVGK